eukprot:scaffold39712_cov18-Tisochrysis_lutea.AAC.1
MVGCSWAGVHHVHFLPDNAAEEHLGGCAAHAVWQQGKCAACTFPVCEALQNRAPQNGCYHLRCWGIVDGGLQLGSIAAKALTSEKDRCLYCKAEGAVLPLQGSGHRVDGQQGRCRRGSGPESVVAEKDQVGLQQACRQVWFTAGGMLVCSRHVDTRCFPGGCMLGSDRASQEIAWISRISMDPGSSSALQEQAVFHKTRQCFRGGCMLRSGGALPEIACLDQAVFHRSRQCSTGPGSAPQEVACLDQAVLPRSRRRFIGGCMPGSGRAASAEDEDNDDGFEGYDGDDGDDDDDVVLYSASHLQARMKPALNACQPPKARARLRMAGCLSVWGSAFVAATLDWWHAWEG